MAIRPTTATIRKDSPRYPDWLQVFGGDTVQVTSLLPHLANGPGDNPILFYSVDVAALDADQRRRLVEHISRKFHVPPQEVERDIADPEHGVPILAVDVTVAIDARLL